MWRSSSARSSPDQSKPGDATADLVARTERIAILDARGGKISAPRRSILAQVKVTQAMSGVGSSFNNVGDTLRRAEDKVSGMRAKADAMESLTESGVLSDPLDSRPKE